MNAPESAIPWHALLAPLPEDEMPERRSVASPELLASGEASAIAGWENLTLHLSAGAAGLRNVLVTLGASGELLSGGDTVLFYHEELRGDSMVRVYDIESIGGRYWPDGSFTGTRWRTRTEEDEQGQEVTTSTPSSPTAEEIASLNQVIAEMIRRGSRGRGA